MAQYPKPNKVLPPCTVTKQEALEYFPDESRCAKHGVYGNDDDTDSGQGLYRPPCYQTHLFTQMKTLEVKKVLPAVMLVSVYSSYADEQEWGKSKELFVVDWDSKQKEFLVHSGNSKSTMKLMQDTKKEEYCLTYTGSRWFKILKYVTLPQEFVPGKFEFSKEAFRRLCARQKVPKHPKLWVQFGEVVDSEVTWNDVKRAKVEWQDKVGIWFDDNAYPFYDVETGYYQQKDRQHIARLVCRKKAV